MNDRYNEYLTQYLSSLMRAREQLFIACDDVPYGPMHRDHKRALIQADRAVGDLIDIVQTILCESK